jgi:hypothetical protein
LQPYMTLRRHTPQTVSCARGGGAPELATAFAWLCAPCSIRSRHLARCLRQRELQLQARCCPVAAGPAPGGPWLDSATLPAERQQLRKVQRSRVRVQLQLRHWRGLCRRAVRDRFAPCCCGTVRTASYRSAALAADDTTCRPRQVNVMPSSVKTISHFSCACPDYSSLV